MPFVISDIYGDWKRSERNIWAFTMKKVLLLGCYEKPPWLSYFKASLWVITFREQESRSLDKSAKR